MLRCIRKPIRHIIQNGYINRGLKAGIVTIIGYTGSGKVYRRRLFLSAVLDNFLLCLGIRVGVFFVVHVPSQFLS